MSDKKQHKDSTRSTKSRFGNILLRIRDKQFMLTQLHGCQTRSNREIYKYSNVQTILSMAYACIHHLCVGSIGGGIVDCSTIVGGSVYCASCNGYFSGRSTRKKS